VGIKHKELSVANKLDITKKVDTQQHVTLNKFAEELGIPVLTFNNNNTMTNKNNIRKQGGISE
jgi:hypothetical protein